MFTVWHALDCLVFNCHGDVAQGIWPMAAEAWLSIHVYLHLATAD